MSHLADKYLVVNEDVQELKETISEFLLSIRDTGHRFDVADNVSSWLGGILDEASLDDDEFIVVAVEKPQAADVLEVGMKVAAIAGKYQPQAGVVTGYFRDQASNNKPIKYGQRPYPQAVVQFDGGPQVRYFGNEVTDYLRPQ